MSGRLGTSGPTHIEKTLSDAYRKEIDQEENVWRSLPFFAATIALQLAAVLQAVTRLPPLGSGAGLVCACLLGLTGGFMGTALGLVSACIFPSPFEHVADETALLALANALMEAEYTDAADGRLTVPDAVSDLKRRLCEQYAVATEHDRKIRRKRDGLRAYAGLSVTSSVMTTLMLVAVIVVHYFP